MYWSHPFDASNGLQIPSVILWAGQIVRVFRPIPLIKTLHSFLVWRVIAYSLQPKIIIAQNSNNLSILDLVSAYWIRIAYKT